MLLDIRTLSFSVSLVSFMAAFIMLLLTILAKQFRAILYWAVGNLFYAIGFTLLMARGSIPDFVSIILANAFSALGLMIVYYGMKRFLGKSYKPIVGFCILVPLLGVFLFFTYVSDNLLVRTIITSIYGAVVLLLIGSMLFRSAPKELKLSYWFAASIFSVVGIFEAARAVMVTQMAPFSSIFSSNWLQILNFSLMIAFEVLWTMGSVFMVTQRLSVELTHTARIDFLTQALNRRAAQERLDQEVKNAERRGRIFSLILVDVDCFKNINDLHGHAAGDAALVQISDIMRKSIRAEDMHSRWGGDEFLIMLAETPELGAMEAALRIQKALKTQKIKYLKKTFACTLSIGIACFGISNRNLEETITQADAALYEAKAKGGNCIVVESAQQNQLTMI